MLDLKQTQEFFWELMQSPGGVGSALADLKAKGRAPVENFTDFLREKKTGEAGERLEAYAQMYFWRLNDSLREDFPLTAALVGEETFHPVIVDFLLQHPSRFRDLAEVSGPFPEFLREHPLVISGKLPYLAEVAELEWRTLAIQTKPNAEELSREQLSKLTPEDFSQLLLQRVPASYLMALSWDIFPLWEYFNQRDQLPPSLEIRPKKSHLLIWRREFSARVLEISDEEAELLQALSRPIPFQELCGLLEGDDPQKTASRASQYLENWIQQGLLTLGG